MYKITPILAGAVQNVKGRLQKKGMLGVYAPNIPFFRRIISELSSPKTVPRNGRQLYVLGAARAIPVHPPHSLPGQRGSEGESGSQMAD